MPGPPPKRPGVRQRRNRASTTANLPGEAPFDPPELPARPPDDPWHPRTHAFWRAVWASPMRQEYLRVHVEGLFLLADLVDQYWYHPSTALASEIRLQRQCFGLTPIDLRRLQWEVDRGERAEEAREQRRSRPAPRKPRSDPRNVLAFGRRKRKRS